MSRIREQRRRAAALGTEVRSRRAAVKRQLASSELDLADLLRDPVEETVPPETAEIAEQIAIGQLLRSVPGFGPAMVGAIVADFQLNPDQPMAELGENHRRLLADEIERT